ncbi:MAG TPA: type II toxin-antitoxin system prevent-host-death family antitoxin [Bacteroidota bacterium]|nr:type II toxin-antitoxin system prevent-host-death family antitoxin [Bacteroidota bacterium]
MKTLEISKATYSLAAYTRKVKREPVVVTRNGKPVAALVSVPNADMETVSLSNNPRFLALIERSRARQYAEGGISPREIRKRLKLSTRYTSDNSKNVK